MEEAIDNVNKEAYTITEKLKISKRVQAISPNEAFLSIKDCKTNFPNNIQCRLLNPTKTEIGKISKKYLEVICNAIWNATNVNHWRNTNSVINWFKYLTCGCSWQKRSYSSNNGVVTGISDGGKVVDYKIMTSKCIYRKKKKSGKDYEDWLLHYDCNINHIGSSGSWKWKGWRKCFLGL